jgi:biopolymer transport protein ExbD
MRHLLSSRSKGRGGAGKERKKSATVTKINITSLTDVMVVLVAFLIKGVSMDVQSVSVPQNMKFPTTMTSEKLAQDSDTVILKVYTDKILLGSDNIYVGSLDDLVTNEKTRKNILLFLTDQTAKIKQHNPKAIPVLMIQADDAVLCNYISEIVNVSVASHFNDIYFSTLQGDTKTKVLKL